MKKLTLVLLLLFTTPAMAAEVFRYDNLTVDLYTSLRLFGGFNQTDTKVSELGISTNSVNTDYPFQLQNNSRFGIKIGYTSRFGDLLGVFEMSATGAEEGNTDNARYRLLYGRYTFMDNFSFAIGKMTLPGTSKNTSIFKNDDMGGYGALTVPRRVAFNFNYSFLNLYVISVDSLQSAIESVGSITPGISSSRVNPYPMLNLAISVPDFLKQYVSGQIYGQFMGASIKNEGALYSTKTDIYAYTVAAYAIPKFYDFSVSLSMYYGVNMALMGNNAGAFIPPMGSADVNGYLTSIRDASSIGFLIAPNYEIINGLTVEAGYGWANTKIPKVNLERADTEKGVMSVYANIRYCFNDFISVTIQGMYNKIESVSSMNTRTTQDNYLVVGQLRLDI